MENLHSAAEAETPLTPSTDAVPPAEDHALATLPDTAAESAPETVVESALDEAVSEAEAGELAEGADAAKAKVKTLHPRAVLNILADRYPAAFHADGRLVKPLAVGVLQELRAAREGEEPLPVTVQDLRRALRYYTQGAAYHRAVARGDARINLLGEAVAEVTEEQKEHAAAKLVELEPKLPKRPERAPRPALVGDSAPGEAGAVEGEEGVAERPRPPRNPMDRRPAGRGQGRGAPRDNAGRDNRNRAPREDRRAAPQAKPEQAAVSAKPESEPSAPLDMNDKLSLLVAKFGR
jgi:sRNA-binding protein